MRAYCKLFPDASDKVRLKLASTLVEHLNRPTEAARLLDAIKDENLDARLRVYRRTLREQAERLIEDGVLEVEEDM
jgi:hypothetical protein